MAIKAVSKKPRKPEIEEMDLLELELVDIETIVKDPTKFNELLLQLALIVGKVQHDLSTLVDGIEKDLAEVKGSDKKGTKVLPGKAILQNVKWGLSELRQYMQLIRGIKK